VVRDFQEIQYLAWWVFLGLVGVGMVIPMILLVAGAYMARLGPNTDTRMAKTVLATLLIGGAASATLFSGWVFLSFGVMTTDVTPSEVRVQFGWVPGYKETVPISEIQSAEAVRYSPSEYGGWGIKGRSDNDRILNLRGNRAVRLQLGEGRQLLIGTQQPEALVKAIEEHCSAPQARP
jgi:hypothetical protein